MDVVEPVQMIHSPGIEKDQYDERIDGTLLGKPETKFEATNANGVQLIDEQDAEPVRTNKPYNHAAKKEPQISLPVGFAVFWCHLLPPALSTCCLRTIYQSIMH